MKNLLLLFCILIGLNSCKNTSENEASTDQLSNKSYEKIEQLNWLLGTWINEAGEEFSQETWSKENDSTFTAFSFTQIGAQTVFSETMALEEKAGRLVLTVATANEKEASPVSFLLVSSEENQFVFENKNHDFPERIIYTNPAKDSLHAWIEGTENGEKKKIEFNFSRKN